MSYREINYQELYNKEKDKVLNLEKELSKFKGENYTLTSKIRNANLKINELDAKMPKFDNKKDIIVDKIILTLALLF
jgi:predicted  nucleic acid-binding Zn-ribbon protein